MRLRLLTAVILACLTCSTSVPARLELERDTLVLYGSEFTWVRINVVDDSGSSAARRVNLVPQDKSIVATSGSAVACRREGVTGIQVAVEDLTTSFVVKCRFAQRIAIESYLDLEPGGPPRSLEATAVLASGGSEVLRPLGATSSDSTVAVVRDSAVVPLTVGHAKIRVDYGGVRATMTVQVSHTVVDDTLALASGESREWRLGPGRYTITVKVKSPRDLGTLNMETRELRCSRDSRDEDTIHCVATEPAEVIFRNTSGGPTARPARAFVRIAQIP